MKQFFLYYRLLCKRFLKKKSFLLILCMIPLFCFGIKMVSTQDSGVLKIVLCAEDENDKDVNALLQRIMEEESVIYFEMSDDAEKAKEAVKNNRADAAWIFVEDYKENIQTFAEEKVTDEPAIIVYEREENVVLQLARMKLFGIIYPDVAYAVYEDFVQKEVLLGEEISEEELREVYDRWHVEENLFCLINNDEENFDGEKSYITAPLRGMLSLLIMLCALSAVMFHFQDKEQGMFEATQQKKVDKLLYVYEAAALTLPALAVLISLYVMNSAGNLLWEVLIMMLYLIDCGLFCVFLRKIVRTPKVFGGCIPFFMLSMFILCPIFLSTKSLRIVQILLPPYYYLNAVHDPGYVMGMVIYAMIAFCTNCIKMGTEMKNIRKKI
ncbi:MAG: ABC transporter permease [Lachnospiraceae bacterium]|nr:ABC transporter permease [Lachnospiraceae bacterium]